MLLLSVISIVYFILIIQVVIPSFSTEETYTGFLYSALGNTPFEAIKTLITHPIDSLSLLFTNHTNHPFANYAKLEFHLFVLLSGGYLLFKKPTYLLMLIPLYTQKLFHDNYLMWSFGGQYVAEFSPILAIGTFSALLEMKKKRNKRFLLLFLFLGTFFTTIRMMDNTVIFTDKSRIRFYQATHYKRNYNVKLVHNQLQQLPSNAKISALSPFIPHLALRNHLYQFPIIKDADYIIYSTLEIPYPQSQEAFDQLIHSLENSTEWGIQYQHEGFTILKRVIIE